MEDPCKIVCFGDSITKEYAPFFEKKLRALYPDKDIKVINAGISGETSGDGLKRIDDVLSNSPDVVIISFGMNDCRKGMPKEDFKKNISEMAERFGMSSIRTILLTINPYYAGHSRNSALADEYSCIIRAVAKDKKIKIADVNSLWKKKFGLIERGLRDGFHPNEKGYQVYCESLLHVVPQSHTVVLWQYNGRECKCNYKCPYCYYSYSPKAENYFWGNIEDWRKAFKDAFGSERLVFYLSFGEPMLGDAFYDVVKMIEDERGWSLRITTNLSQDMKRLMDTRLRKEGRLYINGSFHPTQVTIEEFIRQLFYLRENGIETPVVYVMWPPHFARFQSDFEQFDKHRFLVYVRRFRGYYRGKHYPEAYTEEERQLIARYSDDATIKYMLNEKPVFDRRTYSGFHFFIVDCAGNLGLDSDCFDFYTAYRTIFGNIMQPYTLRIPLEPTEYPKGRIQATVDGVSNYIETGYRQLEENNILSFAEQGGVYHKENGVFYKNRDADFNNRRIRAEYFFPPRDLLDEIYMYRHLGIKDYVNYLFEWRQNLFQRNMISLARKIRARVGKR